MSYFSTGAELLAAINELGASKVGSYIPFDAGFYAAQYGDKNDYDGTLSPLENFVKTGANKLYKPNAQFDPVYYANANADLKALVNAGELNAADLLVHYLKFGLDEGRVATQELADNFNAQAYLDANPDVKAAVEAAAADGAFGGSALNGAVAHYVKFGQAEGRPTGPDDGGEPTTTLLTTGWDNLTGTSGDDTFTAYIFDNQNTLQSGDMINGGAGNDTLFADIGNSQNFAITPHTTGVENIKIRVQAEQVDSSDNNIGSRGWGIIDAERLINEEHLESNNSRADLIIEDVRLDAAQRAAGWVTKDITIAFVDSDPGNVDLGVYFDQQSLIAAPDTTIAPRKLTLELIDLLGYEDNGQPLINLPLTGFRIRLTDGNTITLTADDVNDITTYPGLVAALNDLLEAEGLSEQFRFSLGTQFTATGTTSEGRVLNGVGTRIVLDLIDPEAEPSLGFASLNGQSTSGFVFDQDEVTAEFRYNQQILGTPQDINPLITSTIILDNVGRGSNGGDLVVGGLSTGDTSNSKGVEQFDIIVQRTSKLQTISSTNNTLQVVNIVNGQNGNSQPADGSGDLYILGNLNRWSGEVDNNTLPGSGYENFSSGGAGLVDVRVIDASQMQGALHATVEITGNVAAKYMDLEDSQNNPAADNIAFNYTTGAGDDDLTVVVSESNLANWTVSNDVGSTTREDFNLNILTGTGDDTVTLAVGDYSFGYDGDAGFSGIDLASDSGTTAHWYQNSKLLANLSINTGEGDDTVYKPGSGDVKIDLGAGADTVYVDNTGGYGITDRKAVYVFNTADADGDGFSTATERNLQNLLSDANNTGYRLYKGTVTVNFKGFEATATIPNTNSTAGLVTDLHINQAIKNAINNDPVLSKLLVAKDGPGFTLVVEQLIDGDQFDDNDGAGVTDLQISFARPTSLTASEITTLGTAYGLVGATQASILAVMDGTLSAIASNGDYDTEFATFFGGAPYVGVDSSYNSDNTVTPGLGNDVVVLGTGTFSNDTVVYNGFGNGRDTIVNFDTTWIPEGAVVETPAPGVQEVITVTFADSDGSPAAQTVIFDGVTVELSAPATQGVIPSEDVAYQFAQQFAGNGTDWELVSHDEGTSVVTLRRVVAEEATDAVAGDFSGTYFGAANGNGSVTVTTTVQGVTGGTLGTQSNFTVSFDVAGTAADAAGEFTFDGVSVAYAEGDGAITLAAKLAAATFPNWTVTNLGDGDVLFTANERGDTPIGVAADFDLGTNVIVGAVAGTVGTDDTGTIISTQTPAGPGTGIDYLDFSSYALVDHVEVRHTGGFGTDVFAASGALPSWNVANDAYIRMTENTAANPGVGVYTIELVTLGADASVSTDDTVQLIGVADFGVHEPFHAANFIL